MRVLTVPNWSFGRDRALLGRVQDHLVTLGLHVHFCESDVDHNRTVTAFSGPGPLVFEALLDLGRMILPSIDLNRHSGVHPRIGGLDVCPFVALDGDEKDLVRDVERFAELLAMRFDVPVYLYEKSEIGRHEADLPALRKGGFGSLLERDLNPDFGPSRAHPQIGATVMGVRSWLIALNVNLKGHDSSVAKQIAREIRHLRETGDVRFLGVRALGLPLVSQNLTQVSINLTLPDITPIDPILEWVDHRARDLGLAVKENELIGVIRPRDLEHATRLPFKPEQVVA